MKSERSSNHNDVVSLHQSQVFEFRDPTTKEKEVLKLIALGYSTKEIAERMSTSFNTVETHRKHLLRKFEAKNTAELVQKASKIYWIE
jgi:DNA-binding NarL/FixJ family response regulator